MQLDHTKQKLIDINLRYNSSGQLEAEKHYTEGGYNKTTDWFPVLHADAVEGEKLSRMLTHGSDKATPLHRNFGTKAIFVLSMERNVYLAAWDGPHEYWLEPVPLPTWEGTLLRLGTKPVNLASYIPSTWRQVRSDTVRTLVSQGGILYNLP
jgi:hypothetical protein